MSSATDSEPPIDDGLVFRVCRGPTCGHKGEALGRKLATYLDEQGYTRFALQDWQSCFGKCSLGPNLVVERWRGGTLSEDARLSAMLGGAHPDYRYEHSVTEAELADLVERHVDLYWEDA